MLKEVERTLTGSLPRIHEIDPVTGEHHTSEAAAEGHEGDYVHTGTLTRLTDENDIKVQTQVFDPIDKWISEVDVSPFIISVRGIFLTVMKAVTKPSTVKLSLHKQLYTHLLPFVC